MSYTRGVQVLRYNPLKLICSTRLSWFNLFFASILILLCSPAGSFITMIFPKFFIDFFDIKNIAPLPIFVTKWKFRGGLDTSSPDNSSHAVLFWDRLLPPQSKGSDQGQCLGQAVRPFGSGLGLWLGSGLTEKLSWGEMSRDEKSHPYLESSVIMILNIKLVQHKTRTWC